MPDPVLPGIPPEAMPDDLRAAWKSSVALRGDATFFEVFAHHPDLFRWYVQSFYGDVFRSGRVKQRYKELLRLRLSTLHGCRFCNQGNRQDALSVGLTEREIAALDDPTASVFSPADRAVLRLGERLSLLADQAPLEPDLMAALNEHFDEAQIIELGFIGSVLSGVAKFLFAFDLVEREDSCPFHPQGERDDG